MDNDHFKIAALLRIGAIDVPEGAVCQIKKKNEQEECLHELTSPLVHPLLCKYGPARLRPHRSLCHALARLLRRAGGHVDIERAVPQLYTVEQEGSKITEAILDVVTSHPGGLNKSYVDISIRAPHAQRYKHTDRSPGVAAKGGESDKLSRYGADVLPLCFEPYGRLGPESITALRSLSLAGTTWFNNAHCTSARRLYSMWRAELERCLLFEIADIVLLSMGHSSGFHALRHT